MNRTPTILCRLRLSAFSLVLMLASSAVAYEGIITPLYVGNNEPILDERGRPLHGSNCGSSHANRCRVELRLMLNGQIYAPAPDGKAHANNPLLSEDAVCGIGQNASQSHSGNFCMVFPTRLPAGLQLFARVYNASTIEKASFYVDSAVATVPLYASSMPLTFGDPQPIDTRDIDGDGLVNSWERSLGTDSKFTSDFDQDGISDYNEMLAGTEANDATSQLAFRSIRWENRLARANGDGTLHQPVRIRFSSVPGKRYQVECIPSLAGEQEIRLVGDVITAGEGETELEVWAELPEDSNVGAFRIRLVTD